MWIMGIEWDSGNWPKCGKHGVGRDEIEYVLEHIEIMTPDPFPLEERFFTASQSKFGRYIFVVFTVRVKFEGNYLRPISARYMHQKEIDKYEKAKALAKSQK